MARKKAPPRRANISVSLEEDVIEALRRKADEDSINVSAFVNKLLRERLGLESK